MPTLTRLSDEFVVPVTTTGSYLRSCPPRPVEYAGQSRYAEQDAVGWVSLCREEGAQVGWLVEAGGSLGAAAEMVWLVSCDIELC